MIASDRASSHTEECPFIDGFTIRSGYSYLHRIRMFRQEDFRLPVYLHVSCRSEDFVDGNIREVALPCGSEGAEQCHLECPCPGMSGEIGLCGTVRPHRVAARRAFSDFVYFPYAFHKYRSKYSETLSIRCTLSLPNMLCCAVG